MRLPINHFSLSYALIISTGFFFSLLCVLMILFKLSVKAIAIPIIFTVTVAYMSFQKARRTLHFRSNIASPASV